MEINVKFAGVGAFFVALFVQLTGGFAMRFSHEVILALAAETESFGRAGVVAVPGLGSTML